MQKFTSLVCILLFTLLVSTVSAESHYNVVDLGTLGGSESWAVAINDRGQIIGNSEVADFSGEHAFLWHKGELLDIGTLGGDFSASTAINKRGQIVGYSNTLSGEVRAYIWFRGHIQMLETLGGSSFASDINDRGMIVGSSDVDGDSHAVLWFGNQIVDIGTLGGSWSQALAINERGQVIGQSQTVAGETHAFLWKNGEMIDLGTLGGTSSQPVAINDRGQIIGMSTAENGEWHGFLWHRGEMIPLGMEPTAINNRGQIVGVAYDYTNDEALGLIWRNGRLIELCDGWCVPRALNDRGMATGYKAFPEGNRAFLWHNGELHKLDTLYGSSSAVDINERGTIVGTSWPMDAHNTHAAMWEK